jgi:hypothetical protein
MSGKLVTLLSVLILTAMALILGSTIATHQKPATKEYIRLNDVRGMAIIHKNLEYPLNFEQQVEVVQLFNKSLPVAPGLTDKNLQPADFQKIVIYTFGGPLIELLPLGFKNDILLYSAPSWESSAIMTDTSNGLLKKALMQSYDP